MTSPTLNIAMIGHGFMGAAHSQAYRVAPRFFDLPVTPRMALLVGRRADAAAAAAERWGWDESGNEWRAAIERDDIDLIDIGTPGDSHAEIAIAALEAGKHVLCEKPLANTLAEAEAMAVAAERARARGIRSMVGFTYRRVPAIAFARRLVAQGALGQIREVRGQYLQDWLSDPGSPMTWRLDRASAGSGALGDIGAHVIDLASYVTGLSVRRVSGTVETFVSERPLAGGRGLGASAGADEGGTGRVTVDDAAWFTTRYDSGAIGAFEASRFATGRKNALRLEISGDRGALAFDFERQNELEVYDATQAADRQGFRRILTTEPEHPYAGAWWPTGHGLGYEHAFTHQIVDLVSDIAEERDPSPSFAEGLSVQRVLDAVEVSAAAESRWVDVAGA
ncbi:Gfo/Idh/MocA family protein [Microbacterium trichothecenolyticum]|uniref:Dehydrogenase n=1 Tax=Microbacterium trichothecenolyticum TaxID=69370 RepID=A0ABU0TWV6_MICTR|nr:Gfo/Idh/MocA family oxidoreductase [Microbacterium trichothecenolyticum]MDQ1124147.1 putative dehydrogenase [Microbacterium trichothecenolyticum]